MTDDFTLIETDCIASPYILKRNKPESTKKEKNWNLKGKEIDTWRTGKKRGRHWNTYHEDVIDTLRKKLIEDIQNNELILVRYGFEGISTSLMLKLEKAVKLSVEGIINKRFGVD